MSEMIKRVARYMWENSHDGAWSDVGDGQDESRAIYREEARLAIEAMRQPTPAMMDAIDCGGIKEAWLSGRAWLAGWQAMIDAALTETTGQRT